MNSIQTAAAEFDALLELPTHLAIRDKGGQLGVTGRHQACPPESERGLAGRWVENGDARVAIESYGAQRLALTVDAGGGGAVVGTSITRWPGWRLRIDGRPAPLRTYNRAFLAFRVPAGRHAAVLTYWPDGFAAGLTLSAATLLACAVSAVVLRRTSRGRRAP